MPHHPSHFDPAAPTWVHMVSYWLAILVGVLLVYLTVRWLDARRIR
jgi:hypothetical protein